MLALGPTARSQATTSTLVDRAAEALAPDSVYADPDTDPGLSEAEADMLRERISQSGAGPIYVAILPQQARAEAGATTSAETSVAEIPAEGTSAEATSGKKVLAQLALGLVTIRHTEVRASCRAV